MTILIGVGIGIAFTFGFITGCFIMLNEVETYPESYGVKLGADATDQKRWRIE